MANGFGAPPSPYPDTGGQDLPQPGTPEWAALMARLNDPRLMNYQAYSGMLPANADSEVKIAGPLAATPLPHDPAQGNDDPSRYPEAIARALADMQQQQPVSPPVAAVDKHVDSSRGVQSKPPAVKRATPTAYARPGGEYQVGDPRNPNAPAPAGPLAATDDSMLYPFKAIGGAATPAAPSGAALAPDAAGLPASAVAAQAAQRAAAAAPDATPDASINAHIVMGSGAYGIPGAPSNGAVPNLGYYRPTSGIAQGPGTWTQYQPNDPRMFRGPLASQPAAPAPGPIAPGAGAPWWQKLFGGGQPT